MLPAASSWLLASVSIQRTLDSDARSIEHMRVDHRRAHVFVAKSFLHRADVVTIFEQMSRERMSQRMTGRRFADA